MKRFPQADALRVTACLFVVLIHTSAGSGGRIPLALNQLARFSVPFFAILSGFGHGAAEEKAAPMKRRLGRILVPYLLWSLIYLAADAAFGRPHPAPLTDIVRGTAYMHLYYLLIAAQFVLLCPLLRRAAGRPAAALAAGLVGTGFQIVVVLQAAGMIRSPIPPAMTFLPWLGFYMAGLCLRRRPPKLSAAALASAGTLWALSAAAVLLAARRWPFLRAQTLRPDVALYALTGFIFLWGVFERLPGLARLAGAVSGLTFAVYLSHPLVMRLWNEWAVRREPAVFLGLGPYCLLTLAGSVFIALLLRLTPFGALLGAPPIRADPGSTGGTRHISA